jgi:uncharacterized membrane protein YtjA (UPF0391 family)
MCKSQLLTGRNRLLNQSLECDGALAQVLKQPCRRPAHNHASERTKGVSNAKEHHMLRLVLIFAVIALIAGALGFTGVAGASAGIAKIIFTIFLILVVLAILGVIFGISVF